MDIKHAARRIAAINIGVVGEPFVSLVEEILRQEFGEKSMESFGETLVNGLQEFADKLDEKQLIKEAVEWLRPYSHPGVKIPTSISQSAKFWESLWTCARAYLAQHPDNIDEETLDMISEKIETFAEWSDRMGREGVRP